MGKSKKADAKVENREVEAKADTERKRNTSLRLGHKTLKALKIRAIEEDTSVQQIVERLIEGYLGNTSKKDR